MNKTKSTSDISKKQENITFAFTLKREKVMPKYNVADEGFIDAQPLMVCKTVLDELTGRTHWGPPNVSTKLRGDIPLQEGSFIDLTIHEKGLITKFSFKVTKLEEGKSIEYDVVGDSIGTGKWIFEPFNGKTSMQHLLM